jgi:hypothetical protein
VSKLPQISNRARMLLTFGLFVTALSITIVSLVARLDDSKNIKQITLNNTSDESVFYKTIGLAPPLNNLNKPGRDISSSTFTLEIKVAEQKKEAEKIIDMLSGMGVKAYYTPLNRGGKIVYRVRHGIFTSAAKAKKASAKLRRSNQVDSTVNKL